MPVDQIDVNEPVTLRGVFISQSSGALADPDTIVLTILKPDGSTFAAVPKVTLDHASTGKFSYDMTPNVAGVWTYTFVATGNGVDAEQTEYFLVGKSYEDGPCDPWCMPDDIFACAPLVGIIEGSRDYNRARRAVDAASRILYVLSGRRYPGVCRATVRPCRSSRLWGAAYGPLMLGRSLIGPCGCGAGDMRNCACAGVDQIVLAAEFPVLGVTRVRVNGDVLVNGTNYRMDDHRYLTRIDGDGWPGSQDLSNDPATDDATFDVDFFYGRPVPPDGVLAAQALAANIYGSCTGAGDCGTSEMVRSKSLQGVDIEFVSVEDVVNDEGLTGVRTTDRFLTAERFGSRNRRAVFASPDRMPQTRTTNT